MPNPYINGPKARVGLVTRDMAMVITTTHVLTMSILASFHLV